MSQMLLPLVAHQIHPGEPLPFSVRDASGKLLLAQGHVVASDAQCLALIERGAWVDVQELRAAEAQRAEAARRDDPNRRLTLFDLWEQALWQLDKLLHSVRADSQFPERCAEFTQRLMALVRRDPDIAIYLSIRQDDKRLHLYGLTHALHVALAVQLIGARLGWPEQRIASLVQAALTMNLSIVDLQGRFAVHGMMTESLRNAIRAHPEEAVSQLQAAGITDEVWLKAIVEHHEHPDGQGYPRGIMIVDEGATALRLADVFMAKISPRVERPALPIQEAAKQMYGQSGGSPMAAALIKEYGIYPPGDVVQLASGEMAVVIRRGAAANTPVAAAITDARGMPVTRTTRRDTAQAGYAITAKAPVSKLVTRIPPERLFGLVE